MRAALLTHQAEMLKDTSDYIRVKNPSWASHLDGAVKVLALMAQAEAKAEERARCGQLLRAIKTELR